MKRPGLFPGLLLALLLQLPGPALAALDPVQEGLLAQYALPLRWDNLEGGGEWVTGKRPVYRRSRDLHLVALAPGESLTVRIPAGEQLRLQRPDAPLAAADLEVALGNGSGLFAEAALQAGSDGQSLLLTPAPPLEAPLLARLTLPTTAPQGLELALFFSRREPLGELAPYRRLLRLEGEVAHLRPWRQASSEEFWLLAPKAPRTLKVTGPARLALENRLAYPPAESLQRLGYRITVTVDGSSTQTLEFATTAETSGPITVNGAPALLSRAEVGYLEIPIGEHSLLLDATAPVYLRLLEQEGPDYLFPAWNAPTPDAAAVRAQQQGGPGRPWMEPAEAELSRLTRTPGPSAAESETLALKMARDNSRREGGMVASALLRGAAAAHPDDPRVRSAAERLYGSHTFYRDLLPARKAERSAQRFGWVVVRSLREPRRLQPPLTLADQHLETGLDQLVGGYFVAVPLRGAELAGESVRTRDNRQQLALPADPMFDTDRSDLRPGVQEDLARLAAFLQSGSEGEIKVVGHTDSRASEAYNQGLSERRAASVALFLARQGLDPRRLQVLGRGELEPRASNADPAGMQRNRRVEIVYQPPAEPPAEVPVAEDPLYRLPARTAPGSLRILAYNAGVAGPRSLWIQFDRQTPVQLRLDAGAALEPGAFNPAVGEEALAMLARRHPGLDAGTLGGPFSRRHGAAERVPAASWEFPLPAGIDEVRLWRQQGEEADLFVALQYRAAKPYQLAESGYLEMTRRLVGDSPLEGLRRALSEDALPEGVAGRELVNHWLPLRRFLRARQAQFVASVPPEAELTPLLRPLPEAEMAPLRDQALAAMAAGEPLLALECWTRLLQGLGADRGALWHEAQLGRARALLALGEEPLAERLLRSLFLHGGEPQLRQQAFALLLERARQSGDQEGLQTLLAVQALQQPTPAHLRSLAESLAESGDDELVLMAALALPEADQPLELLLRGAWRLSWWQVYDDLLGRLPEGQRPLWRALRALEQGDYPLARTLLHRGDGSAHPLATALTQALAIHGRLLAPQAASREEAILDWEGWQDSFPGPKRWLEEPTLVTDYAGAETLYSIATDRYSRAMRTAPGQPLKLRFVGPLRLRLEARPLHSPGVSTPFDGWLQLRSAGALRLLPISGNIPSQGLELAGNQQLQPGIAARGEFAFGPGLHELEVACAEGAVLVRPWVQRPELPLGILPPLTPESLSAFAAGGAQQSAEPLAELAQRLEQRRALRSAPSAALTPQALLAAGRIEAALEHYAAAEPDALRQRLTLLVWLAERQPERLPWALAQAEALCAAHPEVAGLRPLLLRLSRQSRWAPVTAVQASAGVRLLPVTGWEPESPSLRVRRALMDPLEKDEELVYGSGALVVGMFNVQPITLELRLAGNDPRMLLPAPLRVSFDLDGAPARQLELSPAEPVATLTLPVGAGRHSLRFSLDNPYADQYLRVRIRERHSGGAPAMVRQVERLWQVASLTEPLRLLVAGPAWLRVDELRQGRIFSSYRLVDEGWQQVVLAPRAGEAEALYRVQQKLVDPGSPTSPSRPFTVAVEPVPEPLLQLPLVATAPQVSFHDRLALGGQEDGTWTLQASAVRRRSVTEDSDGSRNPEQFVELGATHRYYAEDWRSWFKTHFFGRLREEGGPSFGLQETLRHLPRTIPVTLEFEGGGWLQSPAGPTGLEALAGRSPELFPATLAALAPQDQGVEWAAQLRASVSQQRRLGTKTVHLPRLSLFARFLSLERNAQLSSDQATDLYGPLLSQQGLSAVRNSLDRYLPERLDQDVFSRYKADHRYGLTLSDTLEHRPWLDTLWRAGFSLTSNEDFNLLRPDHLGWRLEWQQLVGPLQVNAGYRGAYYLDDGDRSSAGSRNFLTLGLLWDRWRLRQQRLALELELTQDLDRNETLALLSLFWHLGNGRGYRDFWPGEIDFVDLKQRKLTLLENNDLE